MTVLPKVQKPLSGDPLTQCERKRKQHKRYIILNLFIDHVEPDSDEICAPPAVK